MNTPIIDAAQLNSWLASDTPPVVCDVRWTLATGGDRDAYLRGHIPGARFLHMEQDLSSTPGEHGRHPLPTPDAFTASMRTAGVGDDSVVVLYDDGPGTSAARAWWLLRYFGHARAYVLDGGLASWNAAGYAVDDHVPDVPPGTFTVRASLAATVEVADVIAAGRRGLLLDARDLERYQGLVEPVDKVAGHIPGAVNAPTKDNLGADGRFLSPNALRARFEELGVSNETAVTVYCGSGVTAAHEILALESAGYSAALYPGSWSHWIVDEARPVETSTPA